VGTFHLGKRGKGQAGYSQGLILPLPQGAFSHHFLRYFHINRIASVVMGRAIVLRTRSLGVQIFHDHFELFQSSFIQYDSLKNQFE